MTNQTATKEYNNSQAPSRDSLQETAFAGQTGALAGGVAGMTGGAVAGGVTGWSIGMLGGVMIGFFCGTMFTLALIKGKD